MALFANPDFTTMDLRETPDQNKDDWKRQFEASSGAAYDDLVKRTMEHIPVKPLYGYDEYAHMNHLDFASGIPPCLRGPYSTMYVFRPWTVRQYAGFSTAEESNAFYRRNLAAGQKGLSIAFDLPTQIGYDSTDAISEGEVGKVGVAIDSLADMEVLFNKIEIGRASCRERVSSPV